MDLAQKAKLVAEANRANLSLQRYCSLKLGLTVPAPKRGGRRAGRRSKLSPEVAEAIEQDVSYCPLHRLPVSRSTGTCCSVCREAGIEVTQVKLHEAGQVLQNLRLQDERVDYSQSVAIIVTNVQGVKPNVGGIKSVT